jgi:hypothetical protein
MLLMCNVQILKFGLNIIYIFCFFYIYIYRVLIVQAYQMSGGLDSMSSWDSQQDSQTNWRSFIWWSPDHWVSVVPSSVTEASLYSALWCVFMACVRYNLEQRVFIHDFYVEKKNPFESCRRKFCHKFPGTTCPSGDTVSKLV